MNQHWTVKFSLIVSLCLVLSGCIASMYEGEPDGPFLLEEQEDQETQESADPPKGEPSETEEEIIQIDQEEGELPPGIAQLGLETDFTQQSIPLQDIRNGGVGKDGIPAINEPLFVGSDDPETSALNSESLGILVEGEEETRFYPYSILVWHEIVNDVLDERPLSVTFCPLCGTAIAYWSGENAESRDIYRVSGLLWRNNLLMYDEATETLWAQATGEAVVGERLGEELELASSQVITYEQALQIGGESLRILSQETGYNRQYGLDPYGDYEENEVFLFPLSEDVSGHPPKELFVFGWYEGESFALQRERLLEEGEASLTLKNGSELEVTVTDGIVRAEVDSEEVPTGVSMWFSWVIHHSDQRENVWPEEGTPEES